MATRGENAVSALTMLANTERDLSQTHIRHLYTAYNIHFSDLDEVGKLDKIDDKIELKRVSWFFCTKVLGVHHNQFVFPTPYIF